jgi:hypothetical protein
VTVTFGMSMTTSSDGPGNASVLQLAGVSQSPPLAMIQVTVASKVRSSSWLSTGRKPGRTPRRGDEAVTAGNEVRGELRNVRRMGASPGLKMRIKA